MSILDKLLARWRIARAARFIPQGARVLDVGCEDGALFRRLDKHIGSGVGIDPLIHETVEEGCCTLIPGEFPCELPNLDPFDVITMLAVLEHIPPAKQGQLAELCAGLLKPGGRIIVTVPSPFVDKILTALRAVRLVDAMTLEEHHGFRPELTPAIFVGRSFRLHSAKKFQLGLNNIFVFENTAQP